MLQQGPVLRDEDSGMTFVLGYDAVRALLSEPELWAIAARSAGVAATQRTIRLLTTDPPEHGALRRRFSLGYRPQRIAELERRARSAG
jgi:cytochrome P450